MRGQCIVFDAAFDFRSLSCVNIDVNVYEIFLTERPFCSRFEVDNREQILFAKIVLGRCRVRKKFEID